jgi:hypothetical protein
VGLSTRRQISQYDEAQNDHDKRIRALEVTVATKGDITALYERVTDIGDQMNAQHATILKTLLGKQ